MTRYLFQLALPVVVMGCSGCASIGLGEPHVVSDTQVGTRTERMTRDGEISAKVEQEGTEILVNAQRACLATVADVRTVEHVTARDRHNLSAVTDWSFAIGGIGSAGLGAAMIASPQTFVPRDTAPGQMDQTKVGYTVLGVGLALLGAVLITIPIVDAARASGEEETTTQTVERETRQRDVPCGLHPLARAEVTTELGDTPVRLGTTDTTGRLDVDLTGYLTEPTVLALANAADGSMAISVGGQSVANVAVKPLLHHYEDAAWRAASGDACRQSPSVGTCQPVATFLQQYPHGRHAEEARGDILQYEIAAEAQAWDNIKRGAPCVLRPSEDSCGIVTQFLRDHPSGAHAPDAHKALDKWQQAIDKAERDREAAEQRARQEMARRAEAAAQVQQVRERAAAAHAACIGTCSRTCAGDARCRNACIESSCH